MRVLFVGQAPGPKAKRGARAFEGAGAGSRLANYAGLLPGQFLEKFSTVNVLKTWPGRGAGKGDRFPMAYAQRAARKMWSDSCAFCGHDKVVFVGQATVKAFGFVKLLRLQPCEWSGHDKWVAYLPHPSGVNHWYNSHENRQRAERFLRELVKEVS